MSAVILAVVIVLVVILVVALILLIVLVLILILIVHAILPPNIIYGIYRCNRLPIFSGFIPCLKQKTGNQTGKNSGGNTSSRGF